MTIEVISIMSLVASTPYAPIPKDLVQFFAHERMASTCMHCIGMSFGQMSIWFETMLSRWSNSTMWSVWSFSVVGRYAPVSRS